MTDQNDKIAHQASRWLNGPLPVDLMADLAAIMEDENYSPEKRAHQIVWQAVSKIHHKMVRILMQFWINF